jgi:hypothetical protein
MVFCQLDSDLCGQTGEAVLRLRRTLGAVSKEGLEGGGCYLCGLSGQAVRGSPGSFGGVVIFQRLDVG